MRFAFISEQAAEKAFTVTFMCAQLDVSVAGYHAWAGRGPSQRALADEALGEVIVALFDHHQGRYGVRRIHAELGRTGRAVGYKRVQRLMKERGLESVHPRPYKQTTLRGEPAAHLVDLVLRDVHPSAPDLTWVGDITYVKTWQGWAYLATVIDTYSRKLIGWAIAEHMRTELIVEALDMAITRRRPAPGVIFHSDRGSQYTSAQFRDHCRNNGIRPSVGKTGICYDNAVSESFFATIKKELIHLTPWPTLARLKTAVFSYIETYYNRQRIHSTLDYLTPEEYELAFDREALKAA